MAATATTTGQAPASSRSALCTVDSAASVSPATKTVYALGDSANKLFAYQVGATSAAAAYNCPLKIGNTNGQGVGDHSFHQFKARDG